MLFGLNNLSKTTIIISVVVILVIGVGIYLYMKPTNEQFEENKDHCELCGQQERGEYDLEIDED